MCKIIAASYGTFKNWRKGFLRCEKFVVSSWQMFSFVALGVRLV